MNGMMDGMSGLPSGTWTNKYTGDTIFVRDCIIDGDQMMIITNNGPMDMNSFSNSYIQMGDEVNSPGISSRVVNQGTGMNTPMMAGIDKEDIEILQGLNNPSKQVPTQPQPNEIMVEQPIVQTYAVDPEEEKQTFMISKIIDKCLNNGQGPKLELNINWPDFPKNELEMLVNYFDVPIDKISTYIYKNAIPVKLITDALDSFIEKEFGVIPEKPIEDSTVETVSNESE